MNMKLLQSLCLYFIDNFNNKHSKNKLKFILKVIQHSTWESSMFQLQQNSSFMYTNSFIFFGKHREMCIAQTEPVDWWWMLKYYVPNCIRCQTEILNFQLSAEVLMMNDQN